MAALFASSERVRAAMDTVLCPADKVGFDELDLIELSHDHAALCASAVVPTALAPGGGQGLGVRPRVGNPLSSQKSRSNSAFNALDVPLLHVSAAPFRRSRGSGTEDEREP